MEKTTITISKQVYQKLFAYKSIKQIKEKRQITWNEFFEQLLKNSMKDEIQENDEKGEKIKVLDALRLAKEGKGILIIRNPFKRFQKPLTFYKV